MKKLFYIVCMLMSTALIAQPNDIQLKQDNSGHKLIVDGQLLMINGMNWDYIPIGTNFNYSLWNQPDDIIKAALDSEMQLLRNMGVNTIRMYTGVSPRWIEFIYNKYGIYTMLNHSFGRYGLTINGQWLPNTDYSKPEVRELLLAEVKQLAAEYQDTPGLLIYLLGNENNYGLFWEGAETEDIPIEERKSTMKAVSMYKLFNEGVNAIKEIDTEHPVAICNGDLLFLDIIIEECPDVDIFGTNMYRGMSFTDAFERVKNEYGKPILFTEFGSDAFNAIENQEDQFAQAQYNVNNWKEIYENAAGLGKSNNSLGGFTFQFSDGWWKYGQTKNLDIHDNNASWSNGGYKFDYEEGENNMNEEWFGVCAKGPTNERGLYKLYPRAAYYALKKVHQMNPYNYTENPSALTNAIEDIQIMEAVTQARGDKAAMEGERNKKVRMSGFRAELSTFNTGGHLITTPEQENPNVNQYPNQQGFDHMQSFFFDVEANPSANLRARVSLNVLGNVAENPIDQIFYENRGRRQTVQTFTTGGIPNEALVLGDVERVRVYQAEINWKSKYFDLDAFYRTGHYHWGYEGDFFGLYPEANYGPNIDIYNGDAPFGMEVTGKKELEGLKVAFGPQLWWGANPAVLVKYRKSILGFDITGIFHDDIAKQAPAVSSFAIPVRPTRRATLSIEREFGNLGFQIGGIWGGQPFVGETFQIAEQNDEGYAVYQDQIRMEDTWGGKMKVTYSSGPLNWYGQAAAMGLVATGGADYTQTFTGWRLKDSGSGNQFNVLSGFTFSLGDFQIAPNFLWQKPIIGPVPGDIGAPGRPRNVITDAFAVRGNRETVGGEILLNFDPTPGTWLFAWDNDMAEDAPFAITTGFVFRHLPTTMDAAIGISGDGRTIFPFPGAPPAQDLWEAHARIVAKSSPLLGYIINLYGGNAQARGSDPRLIHRYGGDIRLIYKKIKLMGMVKVDDWGPYDYHRDFNLTFPLQINIDLSTSLSKPSWFDLPNSRLGVSYKWRSLNQHSPRYAPIFTIDDIGNIVPGDNLEGFENGREWEFSTYLHVNISN